MAMKVSDEKIGLKSALGMCQMPCSTPTCSVLQLTPRTISSRYPPSFSETVRLASMGMRALFREYGTFCVTVFGGFFSESTRKVK